MPSAQVVEDWRWPWADQRSAAKGSSARPSHSALYVRSEDRLPTPESRAQETAGAGSSAACQGATSDWVKSLQAESLRFPGRVVIAVSVPNYTPTGMRGGMPIFSSHIFSSEPAHAFALGPILRERGKRPSFSHCRRVLTETSMISARSCGYLYIARIIATI